MSGPAGCLPAFQIHPTRRCNLRCLHCYSDSSPRAREELAAEVVIDVVADAAALGYRVLSVSGGEPLLYEALPLVLSAAHAVGMATTVTSNGMLLDERRLAMIEPDADLLAISLDGVPESHNEMRGSKRSFETMAKRLPAVRASGVPFGFIFTLTYHNVNELDWVAEFAIDQGAQLLQIHPLEAVGRAIETLGESLPDAHENGWALIQAARLRERYGERIQIQVDLATLPAIEDQPERIFASEEMICGDSTIADLIAPLVLETSGVVSPLQYGFPRSWCLGNIQEAPLQTLAVDWIRKRYQPFRRLCRNVRSDLLEDPETPVLDWYAAIQEAAALHSPAALVS